ncbi:hypothetical protein AVV29_gp151 [Vibrio phage phi 3]|uniref:Uncharacterized protein n=1 Tax=Vibrio phage phi 3 TaxID=1589298 RepID=A0A0B5H2W3_9CAUD|nr:hypothetical protein AVV29_gp151 [Vibrio phage phi 3]AJF40827.1 hypothetical protein SBVP3_0060 [Vibrio phage phi 3]
MGYQNVVVPVSVIRDGADLLDFCLEYIDYENGDSVLSELKAYTSKDTEIVVSHLMKMEQASEALTSPSGEDMYRVVEYDAPERVHLVAPFSECIAWLKGKGYSTMDETMPIMWAITAKVMV